MGGVHHARWHDAPAQIVIGALMGAVTAQRPTFPRPTRPSGTGGRGGCAEACPTGESCQFQWADQECLQAREQGTTLPANCMKCAEIGRRTFTTRSGGFHRPTRPAFTRPAHYTHNTNQRSCARWNSPGGSVRGGVTDANSCNAFCTNVQGANSSWTPATAAGPATCCCDVNNNRTHFAPVTACCDYTDVAPTGPGGVTEPASSLCPIDGMKFQYCSSTVATVSIVCSAKIALARNCDVFAPPGSPAFNDCEVIYDCVTSAYHNATSGVHATHAPPFETCCPCFATIGAEVPGDQWMDDIQCSSNQNGQGDDDDMVSTLPP